MKTGLIFLLSIFFRIIPHPANFTPMGAASIFSGRILRLRWALPVTFLALFVSDALLSLFRGYPLFMFSSLGVYAGFAFQIILGNRTRNMKGGTFVAAVGGAMGFFLFSNLAVWAEGVMYPLTLNGLFACYVASLPFFQNTILGNLMWVATFQIGFLLASRRFDFLKSARQLPAY